MPSLAWIERAHTYGCAVSVAVPSCRGCASTFGKECVCVVKALRTLIRSVLFPPFVCSCYEYAIQLRGCTPIIDIVARQRAQASTARSTPGVSLSICTAPSILGRRPSVEEVSRVTLWRHSITGATVCRRRGIGSKVSSAMSTERSTTLLGSASPCATAITARHLVQHSQHPCHLLDRPIHGCAASQTRSPPTHWITAPSAASWRRGRRSVRRPSTCARGGTSSRRRSRSDTPTSLTMLAVRIPLQPPPRTRCTTSCRKCCGAWTARN